MGRISILCDSFEDFHKDNFQGIEMEMSEVSERTGRADKSDKHGTRSKWIDVEKLKPIIKENVMSIISLIDEVPLKDKDFEVSELKFNLAIKGETSVSLLSVVSAGVPAHSGITVRITKKQINP
jgi:hypothetical protein